MKPSTRSITGVLLMLAIIPIFAGLLACMPVPIGNPERSRIDPDFSGLWAWEADDESGELYLFQPYDKRTWLMIGVRVEEGPDYEGEPIDTDTAEATFRALGSHEVGADGITTSGTVLYKAWLTKLGGERFMTWEPVGGFDSDGSYLPDFWWVVRVEKRDRDHFDFYAVSSEHEAFEDVRASQEAYEEEHEFADEEEYSRYLQKIRPKWQRALSRVAGNVDDEDLYIAMGSFKRVPHELMEKASRLFEEVIEFDAE
jgi:hypothetical protein